MSYGKGGKGGGKALKSLSVGKTSKLGGMKTTFSASKSISGKR